METFYLMMHTKHIYLLLYDFEHMVKDHTNNKIVNLLLLLHGLLFLINCKYHLTR